uniref:Uncharacterized protein n=1 Tax=Opuntia streptacantha TaxID=393608 RepID=A0A7C9AB91_OPUST
MTQTEALINHCQGLLDLDRDFQSQICPAHILIVCLLDMAVPCHRHQCFCHNHPQHLQGVRGSCLFSDQIREDLQLCREMRVPICSYSIILLVTILGTPSLLEAVHSIVPCHGDVEQIHSSTFHQHLVEEKTMEGLHNLANSVILLYYIRSWRGFHFTFPRAFVTLCCKMARCRRTH